MSQKLGNLLTDPSNKFAHTGCTEQKEYKIYARY